MGIAKIVAESCMWFVIVSPLILRYCKRDARSVGLVLLGFVYHLVEQILLQLPRYYHSVDFIGGYWNWSGKLYAIAGSVIFYLLFRKYLWENDFITVRQKWGSLKPVSFVVVIVLFITGIGAFFDKKITFDAQTIAYQLTMPGFDEELSYRGILLGIFMTSLSGPVRVGKWELGQPGSWITAMLFGLAHGLHLRKEWTLQLDWGYLAYTFSFGWILAWMTLRSRSILMPIVLHNVSNSIGKLIVMVK